MLACACVCTCDTRVNSLLKIISVMNKMPRGRVQSSWRSHGVWVRRALYAMLGRVSCYVGVVRCYVGERLAYK